MFCALETVLPTGRPSTSNVTERHLRLAFGLHADLTAPDTLVARCGFVTSMNLQPAGDSSSAAVDSVAATDATGRGTWVAVAPPVDCDGGGGEAAHHACCHAAARRSRWPPLRGSFALAHGVAMIEPRSHSAGRRNLLTWLGVLLRASAG